MKLKFANALSLALILAMFFTSVGFASDVDVAVVDVTAPTGSVMLQPGQSGPIVINLTVEGNQQGTATFQVYRDWTLSGGTFSGSNAQTFTVPPGNYTSANKWTSSTTGTIAIAAGEPTETRTLAVSAFNITNSNTTGAKLADGDDSSYQVTVSSPPPPIGTVAVILAGGPSSGLLSWTKFDGNTICSGPGNSSSNDTVGSVAFTSLAGVGGGQSIRMTAPTIAGYTFNGWSGAITSTSNPLCLPGSASNQQVTANYILSSQATALTVTSASATYGDSSVTLSATVAPNPGGGSVSFSVNGSSAGSGTVGAGGVATVSFNPGSLNAGTYTIQASFGGSGTFLASNGSGNLSIGQASSSTAVICGAGPFSYTGVAQTPCSASVTGAGGLNQPLTVNYSNNTDAGTATASASYAGDANHTSSSDSKNFTIGQASSTTIVTCEAGPFTYDGTAKEPCSASFSTSDGLNGSLPVGYTDNTNAGTVTASASYAGDANHAGSSDTENFIIGKAVTTTTVICGAGPFTYNGSAQEPCSANVTGPAGLNETLTVSYLDNVNAGQATASATYAESVNYLGSSDTENFTIGKAATTTTVNCGTGPFTYNGSAQEPCSANVTGPAGLDEALSVSYSNNVNAGTASASASYDESSNYFGSSDSVNFTIDKAPVTATAGSGSSTYDTAQHSPAACAISGAYTGDLSCTNSPASVGPNAGTYAITPNVTGTGLDNFEIAIVDGSYVISQAPSITTVTCPVSVYFSGAPYTPCSAVVTGVGGLNQSLTVNYTNNTAVGTATASATYPGDVNHTGSNGSKTFQILAWTLKGFYQPVDMNGVVNTVKGGSTVPLKFEVFAGSTELTDTAIVSTLVKQVTCNATSEDTIEVLATGGTSLRYDSTSGQFIFNWQTPKLPGKCYSVTLTTQDGSSITALFKLK